ncbi:MAG: aminotransferase [Gammaproteobacteria bacterium]
MNKPLNPVFSGLPTTIFTVMSDLANEYEAINLGQGFPDTDGPERLRRAAARAIIDGPNQYPQSRGTAELRRAVAEHDRRFYGIDFDWREEVIVTSGATEALAACLFSVVGEGDEVIVLEPAYDSYAPIIRAAGGVPRFLQLQTPDWHLDMEALAAAINERTGAIMLNSPMNPAGKVFTEQELSLIAELACRHDLYVICDEVYEHLTFDRCRHIPLITFPGMRDRCMRIGSAGKTFSLTGWKVGYICAGRELADTIARAHQFLTFTTAPALQHAVTLGLDSDDGYFHDLAADMQSRRDILAQGLEKIGFTLLPCQGTYFLVVDYSRLDDSRSDEAFCRTITMEAGVAAIPLSAFYQSGAASAPRNLIRFCFCKKPEILKEAVNRLSDYLG